MQVPNDDWILLGRGRHRRVWLLPSGYVLKEAVNVGGGAANQAEADFWKNRQATDETKYARCRMIPNTTHLLMEFIWPANDEAGWQVVTGAKENYPTWSKRFISLNYSDLPKWAQNVDCSQVGFNRQGNLVAYDFSD